MKIEMIRRPSDGFWSFRLYDELGDEVHRCSWWGVSAQATWERALAEFNRWFA